MGHIDDHKLALGRLGVLTDLVEFAEKQKAKGSPHTSVWAPFAKMTYWTALIASLRRSLPPEAVKEFDDARQRRKHRPNCRCDYCTDS